MFCLSLSSHVPPVLQKISVCKLLFSTIFFFFSLFFSLIHFCGQKGCSNLFVSKFPFIKRTHSPSSPYTNYSCKVLNRQPFKCLPSFTMTGSKQQVDFCMRELPKSAIFQSHGSGEPAYESCQCIQPHFNCTEEKE